MANKRGQDVFGMSFGTIFSIIIIIFIVAVAFFVIRHFVGLSKCTNIGLFYDSLREEVRDAWASSTGHYDSIFEGKIPKKGLFGTGIEHVCFGTLNLSNVETSDDNIIRNSLINDYFFDPEGPHNVFIYREDLEPVCDTGLNAIVLKCGNSDCVNIEKFFCVSVEDDGTVKLRMHKQPQDYKITLSKH